MKHVLYLVASAALLASGQLSSPAQATSAQAKTCPKSTSAQDVGDVVRSFFAALAADDDAEVQRLTTPNFYAYDVGKRYSRPELSKVIADAHKSGRIIQWNIGQVDARIDCNLAFAAWENTGAVGSEGQLQARVWLESALLVRHQDRWLIDFLHSTPKDPRK
jgi:hypothetical protein